MSCRNAFILLICLVAGSCSKKPSEPLITPPVVRPLNLISWSINGIASRPTNVDVSRNPLINIKFSASIDKTTVNSNITFKDASGSSVNYNVTYENDSSLNLTPSSQISGLTKYIVNVSESLKSAQGRNLTAGTQITFNTAVDSTDKFTRITDQQLLDLIQKQTFKYFWDFGHPTSGMARERNSSGDVVTTGGTGFGVMSIIAAISRNFITRNEGLLRIAKIVNFVKNNCTPYHGVYAHWVNGATGATVPFSQKDNGADIVETSYLIQGLLCARQYFNSADAAETELRANINTLWNAIEWNWFRQSNQNVLYWHWSSNYFWEMNHQVKGWNEALIVYALAASSNTDSISSPVYHNGWASNGAMKNGSAYYGIPLPLGPALGGPLFFAHYSFLGINPTSLTDVYADYFTQNTAHTKINYNYCVANPRGYAGYSNLCWGLTASDEQNGYSAHAPGNDNGTISPTAAISSLPYTPVESMNALKFFYYKLGDKIWKEYGFVDAFNINNLWFADSFLAIDQGPEIVMIENHRSGLLWNLFMSCPEIKRGMKQLGFQSPNL